MEEPSPKVGLGQEVFGRPPRDVRDLRAHERQGFGHQRSVELPGEDDLPDVLHEAAVARLALAQLVEGPFPLLLRALAFRDVHREYENALRHGFDAELEPARGPIGKCELVFHAPGNALFHAVSESGKHLRALDPGIRVHHGATDQCLLRLPALPSGDIVQVKVAPVEADDLATLQHGIQRRADPQLRVAQRRLQSLALGEVALQLLVHCLHFRRAIADALLQLRVELMQAFLGPGPARVPAGQHEEGKPEECQPRRGETQQRSIQRARAGLDAPVPLGLEPCLFFLHLGKHGACLVHDVLALQQANAARGGFQALAPAHLDRLRHVAQLFLLQGLQPVEAPLLGRIVRGERAQPRQCSG